MRKIKFIATGMITIILFFTAAAQEQVLDTIQIEEMVITGSRQYQSAGNVTQKINVIAATAFEPMVLGNSNLTEAIAQQPGASVSVLSRNDANWGTYSGIGPKYSTYMLNGLPLDAFIDPMSLDLMAFQRIEIQQGPASVLYSNYLSQDFAGNQSPLAGTINLILKDKIESQETQFSNAYGSYNTLNTQLFHQDRKGNLNYFAGINFENSDYTNYGTPDSWLNIQKDPEYQKAKFFAGATWFFGENEKHKMQVFINKTLHKGDAGRIYRGFRHDYTTVNLNESSQINEVLSFNLSVGLRIYNRTWQESHFNEVDSLLSNNGVDQVIIPVNVNIAWRHGNNHLLTIGTDYQAARYQTHSDPLLGYTLYGNKSRAYQSGIYAQEELRFGGFIARGGFRLNYIEHSIDLISGNNPGEPEIDYTRLLWNAGLKYHLTSNFSIFANAGNSFIPPGLKSMGGTIALDDKVVPGRNGQLPNPDLKPESGLGADIGAIIHPLKGMQISLRTFYLLVDDAIVETVVSEDPSQSQSINAGQTSSTGFELAVNQQLNKYFSWYTNYTFMNTEVTNDLEELDGATVPFAPEHIANAGFTLKTGFGLNVTPAFNYNSGYFDSTSPTGRNEFVPGVLLNLFVSQRVVNQTGFLIDLFLKSYNLSDNQYEMPWGFKNTGFSVMGGFKVTLN
ncbi:MAG: TonB-dependent receptor [Bacteroidetes bacterium]|nr:TonB-dependent receptor [Bacteroidota bacterium]